MHTAESRLPAYFEGIGKMRFLGFILIDLTPKRDKGARFHKLGLTKITFYINYVRLYQTKNPF